jgi:hypothetical protein
MAWLTVLGLLVGVAFTVASYLRGPELAYETVGPLWVGAILITIVASWGHGKDSGRGPAWSDLVATAPRWSLAALVITGAHLLGMGGWKILTIKNRTRTADLDPDVVFALQNLCVFILALAVVIAWSALGAHWSQVDLDDLDDDFDLD